MGEATDRKPSAWPVWARRLFYVDALGEPGVFFARLAICLAYVLIAYVGVWNTKCYPIPLGYDAQGNIDYAHVVLHRHRLPTAARYQFVRVGPCACSCSRSWSCASCSTASVTRT